MSELPCGHDSKFGVLLLPKEDHGCLACGYERITAELAAVTALLEAREGRIKKIVDADLLKRAEKTEAELAAAQARITTSHEAKRIAEENELKCAAELDEVRAELAAAQKDAERYRWLRDIHFCNTKWADHFDSIRPKFEKYISGVTLDAAIDSVREAKP